MRLYLAIKRTLTVLAIMAVGGQSRESRCFAASTTDAPSVVVSPEKYKMEITPAWKIGQKFAYVADASAKTQTITLASDHPLSVEVETLCHLEGKGEVLAVGKNGAMSKMSLTVTAMSATVNGKPVVNKPSTEDKPQPTLILAAGAVVIVERNDAGVETFTVDGKPPIGSVLFGKAVPSLIIGKDGQPTYSGSAFYLRKLIDLDNSPATDQDIFGPKDAVAVGDSWSSTPEARTKLLEAFGSEAYRYMAPTNAAGIDSRQIIFPTAPAMMKLESVSGSGNDQRVAVSGVLSLTGLTVPIPPNPLGQAPSPPTSMDIQDKFNLSCPVGTVQGVLTRSSILTIKQYPTTPETPSQTYTGYKSNYELTYTQQYTFQ